MKTLAQMRHEIAKYLEASGQKLLRHGKPIDHATLEDQHVQEAWDMCDTADGLALLNGYYE